jgi:Raf kinase inhibitor-like YbhB/YbcL family protein
MKIVGLGSTNGAKSLAVMVAALLAGCGATSVEERFSMEITSTAFGPNEMVPVEFTCDGANRSPPLQWIDAPKGTRSFALIVDDPNAPSGTFRHWGVYDLAVDRSRLEAGVGNQPTSDLRQAQNDFGNAGYGGPCPPRGHGPHRYRFRLLALDVTKLEVGAKPTVAQILERVEPHVLGSSVLTGQYERR